MSPLRRALAVALAALIGIVLAAAITWGTSQLVRQRIGLSSQPLTAGRRLLPSALGTQPPSRTTETPPRAASPTAPRTQPVPAPSTTTRPPIAPSQAAPNSAPAAPPVPATTAPESVPHANGGSAGEGGDGSSRRDD
jgi:hypothetical protein